jgi:hypothetical protein
MSSPPGRPRFFLPDATPRPVPRPALPATHWPVRAAEPAIRGEATRQLKAAWRRSVARIRSWAVAELARATWSRARLAKVGPETDDKPSAPSSASTGRRDAASLSPPPTLRYAAASVASPPTAVFIKATPPSAASSRTWGNGPPRCRSSKVSREASSRNVAGRLRSGRA